MNTGEKIKAIRKDLGLSAEYVAEKIGVSPSTIYRYENNDIANMKIDKLKSIAILLGTSASYLLGWDDDALDDHLTVSESTLLSTFRDMDPEGQQKVLDYAEDLRATGLYTKCASSDVSETA